MGTAAAPARSLAQPDALRPGGHCDRCPGAGALQPRTATTHTLSQVLHLKWFQFYNSGLTTFGTLSCASRDPCHSLPLSSRVGTCLLPDRTCSGWHQVAWGQIIPDARASVPSHVRQEERQHQLRGRHHALAGRGPGLPRSRSLNLSKWLGFLHRAGQPHPSVTSPGHTRAVFPSRS